LGYSLDTRMSFPPNLDSLNDHEQSIRLKTKDATEASADLSLHFRATEAVMNLVHHLARNDDARDADDLVIRRLGFRAFNSLASAVSAVTTGYYQTAVMIIRDVLETHFLLDYFSTDKTLISVWGAADEKERSKVFNPARIREALDNRDSFTKRKRAEHYKLLCGFGAHASPEGFRLLEPALDGFSECGPFFSAPMLDHISAEIGKIATGFGGQYNSWFEANSVDDHVVKLAFFEAQDEWLCKAYDKEPNTAGREFMRRALARAIAAGGLQ
jgi:hypothetical protein